MERKRKRREKEEEKKTDYGGNAEARRVNLLRQNLRKVTGVEGRLLYQVEAARVSRVFQSLIYFQSLNNVYIYIFYFLFLFSYSNT